MIRVLAVSVFWLVLAASSATRAETILAQLDERAPGGAAWADVLALAVGPLQAGGGGWIARDLAALPNLDPGDDGQPPPRIALFTDVVAEALPGRRGQFALVADSRDFFAVLAVVDLSGAPRLIAAAALAHDRSIALDGVFDLGDGALALDVVATHANAGQGYRIDALALLDAGRLDLVDTLLTLSDLGCGFERRQQSAFAAARSAAARADIEASVIETVVATGENCDTPSPPPSTRRVAVTYRWDDAKRRYAADSDALKALEAETRERF